jgi:inosine/xanthosine triphosphatase
MGLVKIIVVVGSLRKPKLGAVERAMKTLAPHLSFDADTGTDSKISRRRTRSRRVAKVSSVPKIEVIGRDVASGVGHTPISRSELMRGARGRVENLIELAQKEGQRWGFFVGLEGGLDVVRELNARHVFLESWAYVADARGVGYFGQAGGIEIPAALAEEAVTKGIELSDAIDAFAGQRGIRDAQGAWGVLTRNMVTREDAFYMALLNAFAPFVNSQMYR